MKEVFEFRVKENYVKGLFNDKDGKLLAPDLRKVCITRKHPNFAKLGEIDKHFQASNYEKGYAYSSWSIARYYTKKEIERAELFDLQWTRVFDPCGEECGTEYDDSEVCQLCGYGRKQTGDLRLDYRKLPKRADLARSLWWDYLINQRLAEILVDAKITGFELRPTRHKAKYEDDPIRFEWVPTGRKLIQQATELGLKPYSYEFYVWLNREPNQQLSEQAQMEYAEMREKRDAKKKMRLPVWYQLFITSKPLNVVPPTKFGDNPFEVEEEGRDKCPLGHTAGINPLTELFLNREDYDGSDFVQSKQHVGIWRGYYRPYPLIFISPRVRKLFVEYKIRGWRTEIAHLMPFHPST